MCKKSWRTKVFISFLILLNVGLWAGEPASVSVFRHDGSGIFPDAKPPLNWNATEAVPQGVQWRVPLPGPAEISQPILGGDRIYVQSVPFALTCIDANTGKVLWQKERHADDNAAKDSEEEKASRLERYVIFCEREIIGRYGTMKGLKPGRPLTREECYRVAIWGRGVDGAADASKVEPELAALKARIPETWPGSNAETALADNEGYKNHTGLASPTTDGQLVFAHFATGVVVAYDRDGNKRWLRLLTTPEGNLPKTNSYSTVTPLLLQGRLYVPRFTTSPEQNKREPDLHCLDAATGKTLWIKPMGNLSYHGPVSVSRDKRWFVVTPNGASFLPDGTRFPGIWGSSWQGATPAIDHERGILAQGMAVRVPSTGNDHPEVLWNLGSGHGWEEARWLAQHVPEGEKPIPLSQRAQWEARNAAAKPGNPDRRGGLRNYSSPILHQGLFYFFNSGSKVLSVSDMRDGKLEQMFYAEPLPFSEIKDKPRGAIVESPFVYTDLAIAGGYIFIHGWTETVIVKAGTEFQVVGVCPHEESMSNLLFHKDRIYLRGLKQLWCIGQ